MLNEIVAYYLILISCIIRRNLLARFEVTLPLICKFFPSFTYKFILTRVNFIWIQVDFLKWSNYKTNEITFDSICKNYESDDLYTNKAKCSVSDHCTYIQAKTRIPEDDSKMNSTQPVRIMLFCSLLYRIFSVVAFSSVGVRSCFTTTINN